MQHTENEWRIRELIQELYGAMSDNTIERKWKKHAIARVYELEQVRDELAGGSEISDATVKKSVRMAEDLLNQLNRY